MPRGSEGPKGHEFLIYVRLQYTESQMCKTSQVRAGAEGLIANCNKCSLSMPECSVVPHDPSAPHAPCAYLSLGVPHHPMDSCTTRNNFMHVASCRAHTKKIALIKFSVVICDRTYICSKACTACIQKTKPRQKSSAARQSR